ncbi:glycosyltransferase family 2 protein [Actomonas aquatica]|uniref:Glycosyltransferase family 2 protein n=1 Tax=Actomonas aquatica TaxID=2866162 RepID=A0ABZ1C5P9_9BACT|nr:glycosyltransferase family 2 protein [Opitutus sp. WL0086]WRQ86929.1 glycosyltransferase family 2 protein [Opitutus sp. WL0086]
MLESIQVIIPALDEAETIGAVVTELRELGLTRIRVIDNGSRDATANVAREAGAEVIAEARRGYGQACWTGYQNLDPAVEWVLFADADGSDELSDVTRMVAAAQEGADFVLGDRRARPEGRAVMTPVQHFGNGLATTLIRLGWGQRYHDLGPLRLIRRTLLERIDMRDRGFGWTIEMQVRAVEEGARIVELPVTYKPRAGGKSKISGTIRGSVAAGTIILSTLAARWWRKPSVHGLRDSWGGGLVLLGAAMMMPWGDFAEAGTVPWFLGAAGLMSLGWLLSLGGRARAAWWFWAVAIGARLVLLPMAPGDDVWRYLWEGRMQSAGFSPYLHAPDDLYLVTWRDAAWAWINHKEFSAIYPPLAQLALRAVTVVSTSVLAMKLAFIAADLAVVALLARRFGRARTLIYAWNPLVIYVGAGGAHYEPLLVLALVAGWLAWPEGTDDDAWGGRPAQRGRRWLAAWWLGVSVGLKWITAPLVAWMVWARLRVRDWAGAVQLALLGALPVVIGLLWFHFEFGRVGPLAPRDYVAWARTAELMPWLVEQVWPATASRNGIALALFVPVAAWVFFRARTLTEFGEAFLVAMLLFAPSVHAWYFVWLVPWAVATRNAGTLAVSVSAFVYFWLWQRSAVTGEWIQTPLEKLLLWGPLVLGYGWSMRKVRR